jgi:hypothetical protein
MFDVFLVVSVSVLEILPARVEYCETFQDSGGGLEKERVKFTRNARKSGFQNQNDDMTGSQIFH